MGDSGEERSGGWRPARRRSPRSSARCLGRSGRLCWAGRRRRARGRSRCRPPGGAGGAGGGRAPRRRVTARQGRPRRCSARARLRPAHGMRPPARRRAPPALLPLLTCSLGKWRRPGARAGRGLPARAGRRRAGSPAPGARGPPPARARSSAPSRRPAPPLRRPRSVARPPPRPPASRLPAPSRPARRARGVTPRKREATCNRKKLWKEGRGPAPCPPRAPPSARPRPGPHLLYPFLRPRHLPAPPRTSPYVSCVPRPLHRPAAPRIVPHLPAPPRPPGRPASPAGPGDCALCPLAPLGLPAGPDGHAVIPKTTRLRRRRLGTGAPSTESRAREGARCPRARRARPRGSLRAWGLSRGDWGALPEQCASLPRCRSAPFLFPSILLRAFSPLYPKMS